MYIKTVVDSQPLLILPTEQKENQNADKQSFLRLPISVALLEVLQIGCNHSTKSLGIGSLEKSSP
jgi:hypothetical protein